MRKLLLLLTLISIFSTSIFSQKITVEGYAYEENDRGFLNEVKIVILDKNSRAIRAEAFSNLEGFFTVELAQESDFILQSSKKVFKSKEQEFTTKGTPPDKKVYLKVEMERKPGYLFDVTMSERRMAQEPVDAIQHAKIEVYNNTKREESLVLDNYEHPNFNVTFEQGNHYTVMIRKEGFFNKRMEAYVNVKGCILCFDGVGDVRPGVSDVMTKNNTMGTLLANVELDRVELNKSIKIENIYYDLAKWSIRSDAAAELDKLLITLKDNPSIIVELGSHTDCRGQDSYNLDLSQKRAESAVAYLVENGVDAGRISAKGYGETKLVNECEDGVRCSERRHQLNRRTELKITGFLDSDPYSKLSLKEILEEERFQKMLEEVQNEEIIEVREGEELPDEIKNTKKESPEIKKKEENQNPLSSAPTKVEKEAIKINESPTPESKVLVKESINQNFETESIPTKEVETAIITPSNKKNTGKVVTGSDIEIMISTESKTSNSTPNKIIVENKIEPVKTSKSVKSLASDYKGYRVEILTSNTKLPSSHELFSQYGNLTLEEMNDGRYAYLIGDFAEKKDAKSFLQYIIAPRYPKAQVINYLSGRRIRE